MWDIGNASAEESEETYEAKRIEFDDAFFLQFKPNLYLGFRYRFEDLFAVKSVPGGLLDEGEITGAEGGISSGIGLASRFDNRDNILNPKQVNIWKFPRFSFEINKK